MGICDFLAVNGPAPDECPTLQQWLDLLAGYMNEADNFRCGLGAGNPGPGDLDSLWGACPVPQNALAFWVDTLQNNNSSMYTNCFGGVGSWDLIPNCGMARPGMVIAYACRNLTIEEYLDCWIPCDGREISRTTYADLFAITDTRYGAGNGVTTFNVPDLRGRVIVGADNMQTAAGAAGRMTGAAGYGVNYGQGGGLEEVILALGEMPRHRHVVPIEANNVGPWQSGCQSIAGSNNTDIACPLNDFTDFQGNDQPHSNSQPGLTLAWLIKT